MQISHLSKEYIKLPVAAIIAGVAYNPSADVVQMAFPLRGVDPVTNDWKAASWEASGDPNHPWLVRCLVGPGGGTITLLADTTYDCWVKITDSPEVPARRVGIIEVT